jgi:hypothetical protein
MATLFFLKTLNEEQDGVQKLPIRIIVHRLADLLFSAA